MLLRHEFTLSVNVLKQLQLLRESFESGLQLVYFELLLFLLLILRIVCKGLTHKVI